MELFTAALRDVAKTRGGTMNRQTDYTDEPLQIGERVKDFLPPSSELVKRAR